MPTSIVRLEHWVFRAPVAEPVANAFGAMSNRPALFLRLSASDGAWGWGEVFCNFPQVGAEHRARLVDSIFRPLPEGACAEVDANPNPLREEVFLFEIADGWVTLSDARILSIMARL